MVPFGCCSAEFGGLPVVEPDEQGEGGVFAGARLANAPKLVQEGKLGPNDVK